MSSLNRLPNELINVILSYLPLPKIKELCSNSIINECDPIMLEFPGLPIYLKVYYDKKLTRLNYTLLLKQLRSSSLVYNNYFDLTYNSSTDVLIFASKNGHLEVVRLLLSNPKVNLSDQNNNVIILASQYGNSEVVRLLLLDPRVNPSDQNNKAIILASRYGRLEVVRLLLSNPRVNPSDQNNEALISASKNGHLEVVRLLLLDPKLDLLNRYDHAIEWARRYGYLEIVRLLKSKIRL